MWTILIESCGPRHWEIYVDTEPPATYRLTQEPTGWWLHGPPPVGCVHAYAWVGQVRIEPHIALSRAVRKLEAMYRWHPKNMTENSVRYRMGDMLKINSECE
jgi:hypothetical protein